MLQGRCFNCDSPRIRRAHAHSSWQRLVRAVTPFRRYACELCGHRGWTLSTLARAPEGERRADTPGRPLERRDTRAAQRRAWRVVILVILSVLLGLLVAQWATRPGEVSQEQVP